MTTSTSDTSTGQATPSFPGADADDPRWRAVLQRDRSWDGLLWYGVSSTMVYCRPSCPSRRPHRDRVSFYAAHTAARSAGYRACKRCAPDAAHAEANRTTMSTVIRALNYLEQHEETVSLNDLADHAGASRAHFQRQFTRVVGCSPHEWQQSRRAGRLRTELRSGSSVSRAALDAGFDSLPQAYAASAKHLGMSPGKYRRGAPGETVFFAIVPCSLGEALVAMTTRGVCRVILGDNALELEQMLRDEMHRAVVVNDAVALTEVTRAVVAIADGAVSGAPLPLDVQGTAFQQRVWRELTRIPRGETITYAELARRIGSPGAVRAVGSACGANPTALLVPCHRVLRSDGTLGGYRWGLERKARILEAERG